MYEASIFTNNDLSFNSFNDFSVLTNKSPCANKTPIIRFLATQSRQCNSFPRSKSQFEQTTMQCYIFHALKPILRKITRKFKQTDNIQSRLG